MIARTLPPLNDGDIQVVIDGATATVNPVARAVFTVHTTFVHCFEIAKGTLARRTAECLLNYCRGAARAAGFKEAVFAVAEDNKAMQAFLETHGAKRQHAGIIYTLEVK